MSGKSGSSPAPHEGSVVSGRKLPSTAVTARSLESVADLVLRYGNVVLPLALDVADADQVRGVVERTHGHFGRLDVILNNAGYALVGVVEETAEADIKAEFETNFFGTLRVIQAALPLLAQRGADDFLDFFRQSLAPVAGCRWCGAAVL